VRDRLVEHPTPLVRPSREVHLVDERLGDRIGVVIAVRESAHVRVVSDRVEPQQPLAGVTRAPYYTPVDPLPEAEELAGDAVPIGGDRRRGAGRAGAGDQDGRFGHRAVLAAEGAGRRPASRNTGDGAGPQRLVWPTVQLRPSS
jgi:hypothetical protein